MPKLKKNNIKNNILLIFFGFILAFFLGVSLQNGNLLQASILSVEDYNTIKKNKRDIGYKTEKQRIEIFCADEIIPLPDTITITLVFDATTILRDKGEYQGSTNIQKQNGETIITLNNIKNIDCKESLVDIPFEGDIDTILVDSVLLDQKGTKIGNLNQKEKHGN